jgi:hypothetical protein
MLDRMIRWFLLAVGIVLGLGGVVLVIAIAPFLRDTTINRM